MSVDRSGQSVSDSVLRISYEESCIKFYMAVRLPGGHWSEVLLQSSTLVPKLTGGTIHPQNGLRT